MLLSGLSGAVLFIGLSDLVYYSGFYDSYEAQFAGVVDWINWHVIGALFYVFVALVVECIASASILWRLTEA